MPKVEYEIVINGAGGEGLAMVLDGFELVSRSRGRTTLRGWVVDQSGLHGVLDRIAASGHEIISVAPVLD